MCDAGKKAASPALALQDLSLYAVPPRQDDPPPPPLRHHEAGQLEEAVSSLRGLAAPYTGWCRDSYGKFRPKVQRLVRAAQDLKDAPKKDFYPRAAIIGATGVLGLFLARGSRAKRLLYPAGLVTLSASLYYPEQAAWIAKSSGESVYDGAVRSYAAAEKLWKPSSKPKKVAGATSDPGQ